MYIYAWKFVCDPYSVRNKYWWFFQGASAVRSTTRMPPADRSASQCSEYVSLPRDAQRYVDSVAAMGFNLSDVARIVSKLGIDDKLVWSVSYFSFFSPNSIALQADYVTWLKTETDRPMMSVKYCLPVSVFHFWPKVMHPAVLSFCDSWAFCFMNMIKTFSGLFCMWIKTVDNLDVSYFK